MNYLKASYEFISAHTLVCAEACERGLELRLDEFIYDPQAGTYDEELSSRLLAANEVYRNLLLSGGPIKRHSFKHLLVYAQVVLATQIYKIRHPQTFSKALTTLSKSET